MRWEKVLVGGRFIVVMGEPLASKLLKVYVSEDPKGESSIDESGIAGKVTCPGEGIIPYCLESDFE